MWFVGTEGPSRMTTPTRGPTKAFIPVTRPGKAVIALWWFSVTGGRLVPPWTTAVMVPSREQSHRKMAPQAGIGRRMESKLGTKIRCGGGCFFAGFARETADLEVQQSGKSQFRWGRGVPKKQLKKGEGGRRRGGQVTTAALTYRRPPRWQAQCQARCTSLSLNLHNSPWSGWSVWPYRWGHWCLENFSYPRSYN